MTVAATIALVLLGGGAVLAVVRLLIGPTLADRVVAVDLLLTLGVLAVATRAAATGDGTYLDVMVVVAVLGFLGTAMVARFVERRGA